MVFLEENLVSLFPPGTRKLGNLYTSFQLSTVINGGLLGLGEWCYFSRTCGCSAHQRRPSAKEIQMLWGKLQHSR